MTKIKLGNDFNEENESDKAPIEESDQKTSDEESEEEKENSADADESKKPEEETDKESGIDNKTEDADVVEDEDKKDSVEEKPEGKEKELQGLLDTEKDLDKDNTDIDVAISAAKQRISQKRGERREKRDLVDTIDSKFPDKNEETDDLSDIDPETLKVLDRFTKAKGLVPKSEFAKMTYQEQHRMAQDSFYAAHPEYLPENDNNDILYKALKQELAQFVAPSDPKDIFKKFEKAHNLVKQTYPDRFKKEMKSNAGNDNQINKSVRIKIQGLGGKSSAGGTGGNSKDSTKKTFSESQIRALEDGGWSQEEIKKLIG